MNPLCGRITIKLLGICASRITPIKKSIEIFTITPKELAYYVFDTVKGQHSTMVMEVAISGA